MKSLEKILGRINDVVWGPPMLILLNGIYCFLTFRLGIIQRYFSQGIRISFSKHKEGDGDFSQFGSLMIALSATIGTGNIVGVAAGGPGTNKNRGPSGFGFQRRDILGYGCGLRFDRFGRVFADCLVLRGYR